MTLRHLRIYVEVCRSASTTIAANSLNMSQPAVSLAIKELEGYYGVRLFDRISKRLYITSVGERFLNYASHIVSLFDDLEYSIKNMDALGQLRLGSSITIGTQLLPGYVKLFSNQWPLVHLKVTVDSTDVLINKVLNNDLDVALIEGESSSSFLVVEDFLTDELTVICSADHPFAAKGKITLSEIGSEKVLLREPGSGTRDLFDHVMAAHGLIIDPSWESTSTTALINAVANNLGIAIISLRIAQAIPAKEKISIIGIDDVNFQRKFSIIYHKNKFLTPSALAFLKICKQNKTP
jgi:DNA-binding transcriptional LysR family regulator